MHSDRFTQSFPAKEGSCGFPRQFDGAGSVYAHEIKEYEYRLSSYPNSILRKNVETAGHTSGSSGHHYGLDVKLDVARWYYNDVAGQ